jgi:tetratricopeptide (TPR) repeat protein
MGLGAHRRQIAAAAAAIVLSAVADSDGLEAARARAQSSANRPPADKFDVWMAAATGHEPGLDDEPLQTVGSLSSREMQEILAAAREWTSTGPDAAANDLLIRGALLHLDLGILANTGAVVRYTPPPAVGRRPPPSPPGVSVLVADGRYEGLELPNPHWGFGRSLLAAIRPNDAATQSARLWYRAVSAYMSNTGLLSDLVTHLAQARSLFPADAEVFYDSGCLYEVFAAPRIQAAIRASTPPRGTTYGVESFRSNLQQAEGHFRRALAIDPGHAHARVRLGRVLALQERPTEAQPELERAIAGATDAMALYYGLLFLGRLHEERGAADAARATYERASALHPRAQTPHIALSRLARAAGDRGRALQAIAPVLALPDASAEREDPWWGYHFWRRRDADEVFTVLRRPFLLAGGR